VTVTYERNRLVVVGGVAAGASAAAKARRMSEEIEITLLESGPYISFANCGLPYYVGGEIKSRNSLFVTNARDFSARFNVDVRTGTTATRLDRGRQTVTTRDAGGSERELPYDRIILATGTEALRPPVPGLDADSIFTVRTVPDVDRIAARLNSLNVMRAGKRGGPTPRARALVIGAGYIGLETAEQFKHLGLDVTVVELADQVMSTLDSEMAFPIELALKNAGIKVILSDGLREVDEAEGVSVARTASGKEIPFDVGILASGVKPNVELAVEAGIELGRSGAIRVDQHQRTCDQSIFAAGDNSEALHLVTARPVNLPLAGPANKAGRIAGANAALDLIGAGESDPRRLKLQGVLGTAVVRVFGVYAAATGLTERAAKNEGIEYDSVFLTGMNHAGYYPGAEVLQMKVLFEAGSGRLLGGQCCGGAGVERRIDILATAISGGLGIEDLAQLDLCYSPPVGSAKDIAILAGFAGSNVRRGIMPYLSPMELPDFLSANKEAAVVDVRTTREYSKGHLEGAVHIPLDELRGRTEEVPVGGPVLIYCQSGHRSYIAQQMLINLGRTDVLNLIGGYGLFVQHRRMKVV
jgi:NADPH-dependent 2,4-dienoyl-CoA reductase/sulfur reductase-like enzyme/rhodanese-related sulfurtransferase